MSEEREVQEVLARYVRATDARDGKAQGALFTHDAIVRIHTRTGPDSHEPFGEPLIGGAAVEYAVTHFMEPHPEGGFSHHTTSDHIIEVDGDRAHLNAQFIVFRVRTGRRPEDTSGARATVEPYESGYYDTHLRRVDGEWKIVRHDVLLDMPMTVAGV
ncbi:nuclear transport factor 2 family protein [Streptomyces sp. NPDC017673]|uniref:nuclear transport factor 2 family protein n=1 Tax=unclassified Streptomyces TaxID=2593676 RepID=UPI00378FDEE3